MTFSKGDKVWVKVGMFGSLGTGSLKAPIKWVAAVVEDVDCRPLFRGGPVECTYRVRLNRKVHGARYHSSYSGPKYIRAYSKKKPAVSGR